MSSPIPLIICDYAYNMLLTLYLRPNDKVYDRASAIATEFSTGNCIYKVPYDVGILIPSSDRYRELVRDGQVLARDAVANDGALIGVAPPPSQTHADGSMSQSLSIKSPQLRPLGRSNSLDPPSSSAKLDKLTAHQTTELAIYSGRPAPLVGPAIQLYHAAFHTFCELAGSAVPTQLDVNEARVFIHNSLELYDDEAARVDDVIPYLFSRLQGVRSAYLGHRSLRYRTDWNRELSIFLNGLTRTRVNIGLGEFKNKIGTGGSDPQHQVHFDYLYSCSQPDVAEMVQKCCMPAFLISLVGKQVVVEGAIYLGGVVIQELYRVSICPDDIHDRDLEQVSKQLAKVMIALRAGLDRLETYYQEFDIRNAISPFPTVALPGFEHSITYLSYMRSNWRMERPVLRATVELKDGPKDCVVKFTPKYSKDAHREMESLELAVPLIYAELEPTTQWWCIITEFIQTSPNKSLTPAGVQCLRTGLRTFHERGFVFGDLRAVNIIVDAAGMPKLVDFDWAGRHGEVRYPYNINAQANIFPEDVKWGEASLIEPKHDEEMLQMYLKGHPPRSANDRQE